MIEKVEAYSLVCDRCKEIYTEPHTGFSISIDDNFLKEHAFEDGWYVEPKMAYCHECHTQDEEGNLIIKDSVN